MLPFILGGVALAATGYGLKKHLENNNKTLEDTTLDFFDWGDNLGRKIGEFGDSLVYGDEKKDNTLEDVIEEFNKIHNGFYKVIIPDFLYTYEKIENLPELDIDSYSKLEEVATNVSDISEQEKVKLDKYVVKFSKGICAILTELKEIELLQKENCDFNNLSKSKKRKVKDTHALMDELIKVYSIKVINDNGELREKFKKALDYVDSVADEIL